MSHCNAEKYTGECDRVPRVGYSTDKRRDVSCKTHRHTSAHRLLCNGYKEILSSDRVAGSWRWSPTVQSHL